MPRARTVLMMSVALGLSGVLSAQDKDKKTDTPDKKSEPTAKVSKQKQLPSGWRELNLSDEQKQKVYAVKDKYAAEIEKLKDQIDALQAKTVKEQREVLTAAQKKKLDDIIKAKLGGEK